MATLERFKLGIAGQAGRYWVVTIEDSLWVQLEGADVVAKEICGLGAFVARATDLRCGWAALPDGEEVVYLYDRADDNFGYAVNLHDAQASEWGYAPFS